MSRSKSTSHNTRPTIALCVIARDEERFIADCLDSARPFVDEMVVLDTGSTDRTREIAREHGARVETFVWCDDFATARNAAIDAATADWIFMLDADERLEAESGPILRDLPSRMPANIHGACPRIESRALDDKGMYSIAGQVPRFFRRSPDIRYMGAIHEDLVFLPDPTASRNVVVDELRVAHYGYDSSVYAEKNKDKRNTELLERQVATQPNDPRALYFLAQQHHAMARHTEAIEYYERFLANSVGVRDEFVVETYAMLLASLDALERDAEVEATAQAAEAANLLGAAALQTLSAFEARRGDLERAREYFERALDRGLPRGVTADAGTGGWATRLRLAELHERMGDQFLALQELELAYPELPAGARGLVSLQALALSVRAGAPLDGLQWHGRARQDAPDEVDAQLKLFELALLLRQLTGLASLDPVEAAVAREDWQAAYDAAMALQPRGAATYAKLVLVAAHLRAGGAADAALQLLERALDTVTNHPQVYWELVRTLTDLGRFEDAQMAVEAVQVLDAQAA
jgi:glycosyltransferase involved in cell wall biosynthesis